MLRIRVGDHEQARSLCAFLHDVSAAAERTSDPELLVAELPGALTPEHERRELAGYVRTWRLLNPGATALLEDAA